MFTEGYSFPHPVLGNEDDIEGEFNVEARVFRSTDRKIVIERKQLEMTNAYLGTLIDAGFADYYLRVFCSSTLSTWMVPFKERFEIHEDEIANQVEIQFYVIAKGVIENFKDLSFNSQYGEEKFTLVSNEVLAISGKVRVPIPKTNEKLGLGNIFSWCSHSSDKPIDFQCVEDKIRISYPVTQAGGHPPNMLFSVPKYRWTAYNIFAVPALAYALEQMKTNAEESSKWEWYMVLDGLLPESSRSENYFSDAQLILGSSLPSILACESLTKE